MPGAGSTRALPTRGCRPWMRLCCWPPSWASAPMSRSSPIGAANTATAAAVATAVERLRGRAPAVLVSSFLPSALAALRDLAPQIPRGVLFRFIPRGWAEMALRLGCAMIGADHRRLRRASHRRDPGRRIRARRLHRQRPGARASLVRLGGDFRFFRRSRYNLQRERGSQPGLGAAGSDAVKPLNPIVISGREVLPLVEGGKGISISNGESSGAWAASGAVGTFSGRQRRQLQRGGRADPAALFRPDPARTPRGAGRLRDRRRHSAGARRP